MFSNKILVNAFQSYPDTYFQNRNIAGNLFFKPVEFHEKFCLITISEETIQQFNLIQQFFMNDLILFKYLPHPALVNTV